MEFWAGREAGADNASALAPVMRYSVNSTVDIVPVADGSLANRVLIPVTGNTETGALPSPNTINHVRCFNENNVEIALIALTQAGAQAHVCTATNQLPNVSFTDTDTNHIYTFSQSQLDNGVYDLRTPWSLTSEPARIGSRTHQHNLAGKLMFRQLHFDQVGNRDTAADSNPRVYSTDIPAPQAQMYRKYSWRQQTNNYNASTFGTTPGDSWGKEITIRPVGFNATDDNVTASRTNGYDLYTGSSDSAQPDGWETVTSILDETDALVALSGYATTSDALAAYDVTGMTEGHDVHVGLKALVYDGLNHSNVDASNTLVPLNHTLGDNNRITLPGSLQVNGQNIRRPETVVGTPTGQSVFRLGTNGLSSDSFVTSVQADMGLSIINGGFTNASAQEQLFDWRGSFIDFGGNGCLGQFTATGTGDNTLRNVPSSVPANLTMSGSIQKDTTTADETISFAPATDTSRVRLTTSGAGTGRLIITGKNANDFANAAEINANSNIQVRGTVVLTFPRAGKVMIGRTRSGTYSTLETFAGNRDGIIDVNPNGTLILSGADYNAADIVHVFYRPLDTDPNSNTNRYALSGVQFPFSQGDTLIPAERIVEPLLDGVDSEFTPTGTPDFTTYGTAPTGGVNVEVDIGSNLDLPGTKEFFLWLTNEDDYIRAVARNNAERPVVIGVRGIAVNADVLVLSKPAATAQLEMTGVGINTAGDSLVQTNAADNENSYLIALTGTVRDFYY